MTILGGHQGLEIEAEDYIWAGHKSADYPNARYFAHGTSQLMQQDPGNTSLLILEGPPVFQNNSNALLYIYANSDDNGNWGGAQLWASTDNVNYNYIDDVTDAWALRNSWQHIARSHNTSPGHEFNGL